MISIAHVIVSRDNYFQRYSASMCSSNTLRTLIESAGDHHSNREQIWLWVQEESLYCAKMEWSNWKTWVCLPEQTAMSSPCLLPQAHQLPLVGATDQSLQQLSWHPELAFHCVLVGLLASCLASLLSPQPLLWWIWQEPACPLLSASWEWQNTWGSEVKWPVYWSLLRIFLRIKVSSPQ